MVRCIDKENVRLMTWHSISQRHKCFTALMEQTYMGKFSGVEIANGNSPVVFYRRSCIELIS